MISKDHAEMVGTHYFLIAHACEYRIVVDNGWYDGTKPELNVRKLVTLNTLKNLNFAKHEELIKSVMSSRYEDRQPYENGYLYAITPEQEKALVKANRQQDILDQIDGIEYSIKRYETLISAFERQTTKPATIFDAKREVKKWNDIYNEGGEGFLPTVISREDYVHYLQEITSLRNKLNALRREVD